MRMLLSEGKKYLNSGTMQLYLIRHAESENNAKPPYERIEDPAITARGRLQAEYLASWAESLEIDFLITSPFRRSLETTSFILNRSPQPVHVWHNVFERGGCFRGHGPDATEGGPGMTRAEILRFAASFPQEFVIDETITEEGWWGSQLRESDQEAGARASVVIDRLIKTFGSRGETIVAVIHADFKRCLLNQMLTGVADIDRLGSLVNTGISKLNYDGESWHLQWLNSASHLPARLVTGNEA